MRSVIQTHPRTILESRKYRASWEKMKSNEIMGIRVIQRINITGNGNPGHYRLFPGTPGRNDIDLNAILSGFKTENRHKRSAPERPGTEKSTGYR